MSVKGALGILFIFLLQACGGGGGGGGGTTPSSTPIVVSSVSSQSSSSSVAAQTLPILNIKTDVVPPIITRDTYIKASYSLTDMKGVTTAGAMEMRGRGNSTWDWPKKPYRLKLTNTAPLLDMPTSKNWVLLANYADKTMVRNEIAFEFSRILGFEYTPRAQAVDLYLNGNYQGIYQLAEHIRIDKDRVSIPSMKVTDTDASKITGGYLLEVDFRHHKDYCINGWWDSACVNGVNTRRLEDYCIDSKHGMDPACLEDPDTLLDAAWSAQRDYITKYYNDFEEALFGPNFKDPNLGYAAYVDVDSVVNYYLANEVLKNVDGASASFFLYKKRDGKLYFGPIWDFDLALGNAGYEDADKSYGWRVRSFPWFSRFFNDPAFSEKVTARWKALKAEGKIDQMEKYAEERALWMKGLQPRNYAIWSVVDFVDWLYHTPYGSYDAEVNAMLRFQRERHAWIDKQFQ